MPPELLLSYEQTLIYWAKLLVVIKRWDRVSFILSLVDTKQPFFQADLAYLEALVCYNQEPLADTLGCEKALRRALKADPLHQESLVLLASIYLKNKDLMPASEAETLVTNALYAGLTQSAL